MADRPGMMVGPYEHEVIGDMLEIGEEAPDFTLINNDLSEKTLADYGGKVKVFIEPEQERFYRELNDISTAHQRRFDIGERLARIGDTQLHIGLLDNGLPDIEWLRVKVPKSVQKTPSSKTKTAKSTASSP